MKNAAHCPHCRASYRQSDFGTDLNGRLVLIHVCVRRDLVPYKVTPEELAQRKARRRETMRQTRLKWFRLGKQRKCIDCRKSWSTKRSDRCRKCQKGHWSRLAIQQAKRKAS